MISPTSINIPPLPLNFGFATASKSPVEGPSFHDLFLKSLQQTASVDSTDSMPDAALTPHMLMEVRDQLMDAYDEIIQMQF